MGQNKVFAAYLHEISIQINTLWDNEMRGLSSSGLRLSNAKEISD